MSRNQIDAIIESWEHMLSTYDINDGRVITLENCILDLEQVRDSNRSIGRTVEFFKEELEKARSVHDTDKEYVLENCIYDIDGLV